MDTAGDEHYTLRFRDLTTGTDLDDQIDDTSHAGIAWSRDGNWVFYVTPDAQERPSKVWRHRLGTPRTDDVCVFDETDERFFVAIGSTRSEAWIVIHSASRTSADARIIPTDRPTDDPIVVMARRDDVEYGVDHWGDSFVMHTNDEAVDFRLLVADDAADIDRSRSVERAGSASAGSTHPRRRRLRRATSLIHEWVDAQPRLRILFRDRSERVIDLGRRTARRRTGRQPAVDDRSRALHGPVADAADDAVRRARVDRRAHAAAPDPHTRTSTSTRTPPNGCGPRAADGTQVPIDIVRHIDTPLDGTAPGVLYGYGAYEASLPPWFSVARLSLLDRGYVWALAHPRGGGELGRNWYLDGKLLAKPNTFSDMIACAEHLARGLAIVAADRLAIRGGSAGGLLVAACMTKRPDLFASVVAEVPFVDVVSTMSDPTLPLTVTEWEEWGDPRSEPYASCMLSYSPYDNTVAADYPAVYATAGLNDPRVSVHEPAKWVARLRDVSTGSAPIVLRTELVAGHGGPTGRYEAWRDEARTLAFILATT